jgi:hypothetical protein
MFDVACLGLKNGFDDSFRNGALRVHMVWDTRKCLTFLTGSMVGADKNGGYQ